MIKYLYQEITEEEKKEIDKALICDSELRALYTELCAVKKDMDAAQLQPSNSTVLNILSYSRSLSADKQGLSEKRS